MFHHKYAHYSWKLHGKVNYLIKTGARFSTLMLLFWKFWFVKICKNGKMFTWIWVFSLYVWKIETLFQKIKRSKVTDYATLKKSCQDPPPPSQNELFPNPTSSYPHLYMNEYSGPGHSSQGKYTICLSMSNNCLLWNEHILLTWNLIFWPLSSFMSRLDYMMRVQFRSVLSKAIWSGPEVINLFSCSNQLGPIFQLLIKTIITKSKEVVLFKVSQMFCLSCW